MKKTCRNLFFLLFGFLAIFAFSGGNVLVSLNFETEAQDVVEEIVSSASTTISSAETLQSYVQNWGSSNSSDSVLIGADINMSGVTVSGTIGAADSAFSGSFSGGGHTISNLTISVDASQMGSAVYAGLFGNLSGASINNVTFSNLTIKVSDVSAAASLYAGLVGYAYSSEISAVSLSGTLSITWSNGSISYVGGLVGRADECTIKNVQNSSGSSKMTLSSAFTGVNYLSVLVGRADNSTVSQVILRRSLSQIEFSSATDSTTYFGTAVGGLTGGSSLTFADIECDLIFSSTSGFLGSAYVGGAVGLISGGRTSAQNLAISNSYTISDLAGGISVGEVGGIVSYPVPSSGNISYIWYESTSHERISQGSYTFESTDCVKESSTTLRSLASTTDGEGNVSYTYFSSQTWAPLLGEWDFDTVFYVTSENALALQCFYSSFSVETQDTSVLEASGDVSSATYGESVDLTFLFAVGMEKYYAPNSLYLGNSVVATILMTGSGSGATYTISAPDVYQISSCSVSAGTSTQYGFKVTIASVNMSTAGKYYISCTPNSYSMTVVATTYSITGTETLSENLDPSNIVLDTSIVPGYVYYSTSSTKMNKLSRNITIESTNLNLESSVISGYAYAFSGYWLVETENSRKLVNSKVLSFSLQDYADGDAESFAIYALYSDDACTITFDVGEGVEAIYVGGTKIGDDLSIIVAKSLTELKIEIRISLDYELDTELFEDSTDVFKGKISADSQTTNEEEGYVSYVYTFDMSTLADASFSDALNLKVHTSEIDNSSNLIWWLLGGVLGGLLVVGLVVGLVIWIVKKRQGFGGSSFKSTKRGGLYY